MPSARTKQTKPRTAAQSLENASSVTCVKCGSPMKLRDGRYGQFWGCTNYPRCQHIEKLNKQEKSYLKTSTPQAALSTEPAKRPPHEMTAEQRTITEAVLSGRSIVQVNAGAGCSKTTELCYIAFDVYEQFPEKTIGAFSFNKPIAAELQTKMPPNTKSSTLHSWSFAQWKRIMALTNQGTVKLDTDKVRRIATELYPPTRDDKTEDAKRRAIVSMICKIVGIAKGQLSYKNDPQSIDAIIEEYLDSDALDGIHSEVTLAVPTVYMRSMQQKLLVDFDDMLLFPAQLIKKAIETGSVLPIETFDIVLGDEWQDTNEVQHWLALGAVGCASGKIGQMVFVGDVNQAIYGFRGADYRSMGNFAELAAKHMKASVLSLPLMTTMRCAVNITLQCNLLVSTLRARDNAPAGIVKKIKNVDEKINDIRDNPGRFMILSRCNAPLVEQAFDLIRQRIPVHIMGRDIAGKLLTLIVNSRAQNVTQLVDYCDKRINAITEKAGDDPKPRQIDEIDRLSTLITFCEEVSTLDELKEMIETLFTDEGNNKKSVLLSSIHKAKGLERHAVICIPVHAPHPMAKTPQAIEQEHNLSYVAWSRAKEELYIVPDPKRGYFYQVLEA